MATRIELPGVQRGERRIAGVLFVDGVARGARVGPNATRRLLDLGAQFIPEEEPTVEPVEVVLPEPAGIGVAAPVEDVPSADEES